MAATEKGQEGQICMCNICLKYVNNACNGRCLVYVTKVKKKQTLIVLVVNVCRLNDFQMKTEILFVCFLL